MSDTPTLAPPILRPLLERSSHGRCPIYLPTLVNPATIRPRTRPVGFSAEDYIVHYTGGQLASYRWYVQMVSGTPT